MHITLSWNKTATSERELLMFLNEEEMIKYYLLRHAMCHSNASLLGAPPSGTWPQTCVCLWWQCRLPAHSRPKRPLSARVPPAHRRCCLQLHLTETYNNITGLAVGFHQFRRCCLQLHLTETYNHITGLAVGFHQFRRCCLQLPLTETYNNITGLAVGFHQFVYTYIPRNLPFNMGSIIDAQSTACISIVRKHLHYVHIHHNHSVKTVNKQHTLRISVQTCTTWTSTTRLTMHSSMLYSPYFAQCPGLS